jgi:hypothetical protein
LTASRLTGALDFLLSSIYDETSLHPAHAADLARSGITDETRRAQKIRTVCPPYVIDGLLDRDVPQVLHAYVIPFADPSGGWFNHIRLKVFPAFTAGDGSTVKYLGPKGDGPRVFFTMASLEAVCRSTAPAWIIEGAKKALAVSQLGLPAVGIEGIEGWHVRGSRELLPDFDLIPLRGRTVDVCPDGDWRSNPHVARGAERLALALEGRGARVRIVALPETAVAA